MQTQKSRATVESRQHANVKECIAILSWTEFFFFIKRVVPLHFYEQKCESFLDR